MTEFLPFSSEARKVVGLKPGKALGSDGIPPEVIREMASQKPVLLLRMYNACLRECMFPEIWKKQRLVLISKGKDDPEDFSEIWSQSMGVAVRARCYCLRLWMVKTRLKVSDGTMC